MKNKELQQLLASYPENMEIKLNTSDTIPGSQIIEFTEDNILLTSDTAYVNEDVPEEEWNTEDGKIELGDGEKYLLLNPIIG